MFRFQDWINTFHSYNVRIGEIYNDAEGYNVQIETLENPNWRVLGIHKLTPEENRGNHNVYVEALCKQWERNGNQVFHWTWVGRKDYERAPDFWAGQKPPNELVNLPLNLGMTVSVWTNGGEKVINFSSNHPDENEGNTLGYHSYFVCFQEVNYNPEPLPKPQQPSPVIVKVTANLKWLNALPVDNQGNVIFEVKNE